MNWQTIDDKHRRKYKRTFVACDDPDERAYLISLIKETLPYYARADIEQAVDEGCQMLDAPRLRQTFLRHVRDTLEAGAD